MQLNFVSRFAFLVKYECTLLLGIVVTICVIIWSLILPQVYQLNFGYPVTKKCKSSSIILMLRFNYCTGVFTIRDLGCKVCHVQGEVLSLSER